jgi:hypothetical protein
MLAKTPRRCIWMTIDFVTFVMSARRCSHWMDARGGRIDWVLQRRLLGFAPGRSWRFWEDRNHEPAPKKSRRECCCLGMLPGIARANLILPSAHRSRSRPPLQAFVTVIPGIALVCLDRPPAHVPFGPEFRKV